MKVTVDHIGGRGDGVAGREGQEIYVPYAAPGDVLDVTLTGKQAGIKKILTPSSLRVPPVCRHFTRCGGCALQHVQSSAYARWKQDQLRLALSRRGFGEVEIAAPEISPKASRRRARLQAVGRGAGKAVLGFAERGSHHLVDLEECPVMVAEIVALVPPLRAFLGRILEKRQKMAVEVTRAENGLDLVFETAGDPSLELRMEIAAFAEAQDIARISWKDTTLKQGGYELLLERRRPYALFGSGAVERRRVLIPPGSFLQATREGEQALVRIMMQVLPESGKLVDIFAGAGTFTVPALERLAVHAVEGSADMVEALSRSIHLQPPGREFSAEQRDLFLRPLLRHELKEYDVAVIDPPRAGAREQVMELAASDIPVIVMISCNPGTFARDARTLVNAGYRMGAVTPVDQFLYSPHLEVVAVFSK
tara:strand:- start:9939 stop:11204 length:1266 start_codon:yes stop_codon:yes gene_type:complete